MNRASGVALSFLLAPLLAFACNDQKASVRNVTPVTRDDEAERRARMVETQIVARGVRDPCVLTAMREVQRHLFVDPAQRAQAYEDHPLPIAGNQTISQPYIVALMTELAEVKPNEKVLEIGTGSGYQSAVLSRCAREVYSIEIVPELARASGERLRRLGYGKVTVKEGDGYRGWSEHAPFDAIIVTAAAGHLPPPLWQQLKPDGRIVIPIGSPHEVQRLVLVTKTPDGKRRSRTITEVRFVPLTGGR